ncbi:endonuclease/exonuclease/phosphatase family protein [Acholeplasma sp. OttesenSCG-928-E16]|nr:endonuclease/exonuclease/phosphatase family protein [Acholeplasma sp. OttesenSCG-928-E16]
MEHNIMTFNMRIDQTSDGMNSWPYRLSSVSQFLKETKPLIIGAQEVSKAMRDGVLTLTGDYYSFGMPRTTEGEGTPILYNHRVLYLIDGGTFWLSETPTVPDSISFDAAYHRICTYATFCFRVDRTKRFRVYNTHLDNKSELARMKGIEIIFEHIKKRNDKEEHLPTFLMGDLNAEHGSDVLKYIESRKDDPSLPTNNAFSLMKKEDVGATFHGYEGKTKGDPLDFIFYTDDLKVSNPVIFREKINDRYISDHYPVYVKVEF